MDEKIRNTAYHSCIAYDIKFWGLVFIINFYNLTIRTLAEILF